MTWILDHLEERGLLPELYPGMGYDEEVARFPLHNFAGKMTGVIQYCPNADKIRDNRGRYITYITAGEVGVFGVDSLSNPGPIFIVGGMFKAATLHRLGYASLHVSSVSPKSLRPQLQLLHRRFFAIGDADVEGAQFARRWGGWQSPVDVDEMYDKDIIMMIKRESGYV